MAKKFERDEFDHIADQGGPLGVHRAPRSVASRILPILLAFVIAGALAYALATYYWNQDSGSAPTPSGPVVTLSPSPTDEPVPAPEPSPTPTPSPEPEPEPVIDFEAEISVLNSSGIGGLAGSNQEKLATEGFSNVAAGNITSDLPNTVIYSSADQADTAALIAEILGIDNVEQGTPPGGASIEVILTSDPDA